MFVGFRATIDAFTGGWTGPLHILVDNAGVMALPERTTTKEGWGQSKTVGRPHA